MKKDFPLIFASCFLLIFFIFQLHFIQQPVSDNDEGIYTTTFLLISKGHSAYTQTFLSQPPGFLLSVYPLFLLFGKTLHAARLAIVIYSMMGLISLLIIGYELKNFWIGILSIGLLILSQSFANQIHTFQSDGLVNAFTLISFAMLLLFKRDKKIIWYICSIFFLNLSFWTKLSFFFVPSFFILLISILDDERIIQNKKIYTIKKYVVEFFSLFITNQGKKLILIFIIITLLFLYLFQQLFGLSTIFNIVLGLRLSSFGKARISPLLFAYLKQDSILLGIILSAIILTFIKNKFVFKLPILPVLFWSVLSFAFFFFYRPLFFHHISMLAAPFVLLFSILLSRVLNKHKNIYAAIGIIICTTAVLITYIKYTKIPQYFLPNNQKQIVNIITNSTKQTDEIVTDEEILNTTTQRMPPPQLSDLSFVRIDSGNLTKEKFEQIINITHPKLLIPWNGRLKLLLTSNVLKQYQPLITINRNIIYIRK